MSAIQTNILSFSNRLREALGVSNVDYCSTKYMHAQWHTPNYIINLSHRCFIEGWFDVFEAYTRFDRRETLIDVWNVKDHLPENVPWHYRFKGTGTENLPPAYYQDMILDEIRGTEQKIYWIDHNGRKNYNPWPDPNPIEHIDEVIKSRFDILDL